MVNTIIHENQNMREEGVSMRRNLKRKGHLPKTRIAHAGQQMGEEKQGLKNGRSNSGG